ncbi:MAG: c-type cytochrome domain-containing protein [Akkermansiaceae bacterium]
MRRAIPFSLAIISSLSGAEKITYDDHVFPILESSCLNCHNPDKKKGGLDLSTFQGTLAGGSGGKVAVPGDGASSKLYTTTVHTEEPVMPPEGDKIDKKHADMIRAWIDGGLLENNSSKARKAKKPSISLAVVDPQKRPDGPLPMPQDLLLEPVVVPPRGTVVNDMEASPWAPLLAITGQRQILLYHTDSLELVGVLPFPFGTPETVSFHPSGKYLLAAGGIGGKSGTTITWDVTNGNVLMTMGKEFDSILAADIRADLGGIALGGPSRLIKLWDTQANEQLLKIKKHTDWVTALSYSPDGVLLATGDRNNGIQIWEAATGNEFHTLRGHQKAIVDLKWRSDSNLVASASEDGEIRFWDMNRGKEVKKTRAHNAVLALDYARDGHLISSGRDKKVKIWKPDLGLKKELPAFKAEITEVEFSHDGKRFFTADWNGHIQGWDTTSYQQLGTLDSTPPTIADRLVELMARTSALKAETEKLTAILPKKEKAVTDSENWLKTLQKKIPELKNQRVELNKAITREENELKKFAQLASQAKQESEALGHEATSYRQTASDLSALRKKLVDSLGKARSEMATDQMISFEKQLADLDQRLAASRDAADRAKIDQQSKIKEHQEAGKERQDAANRKTNHQKILQQVNTKLLKAEKDLPAAIKGLDWNKKQLKEAHDKVAAAKTIEESHHQSIRRWQAAAVNTELLSAQQKLTQARGFLAVLHEDLRNAAQNAGPQEVIQIKNKIDAQAVELSKALKTQGSLQAKYQGMKRALESNSGK